MKTWNTGEAINLRLHDRDGVPRGCEPLVVVEDSGDFVVAWMPEGTAFVRPRLSDGRDIRDAAMPDRFQLPRTYVTDRWRGHGTLRLIPMHEPHELILFWGPDGTFQNWYVNFEWPHRRWQRGIDTRDLLLDLIIDPDLRWRWKDEDEFGAALDAGWLNAEEATVVRREADRVVSMLDHWPPPRYAGWEHFRPDPAWGIPEPHGPTSGAR